jgi:hypothetical protein
MRAIPSPIPDDPPVTRAAFSMSHLCNSAGAAPATPNV